IATGGDNTALGAESGPSVTGGTLNILIGESQNISSGSSNIIIGNAISSTTATASNQLDIGDAITAANMTTGPITLRGGEISGGTKFTITSGCATISATVGGATAGQFSTTTTG